MRSVIENNPREKQAMEISRLKWVNCVIKNVKVIKSGIQRKKVVKYVEEYMVEKLVLKLLLLEKKPCGFVFTNLF